MQVRKFSNLRDFKTLCVWLAGHKLPKMPVSSLSKNGYMVGDQDGDLVCGFLYTTDSDLGWIEGVVKDPKADKIEVSEALCVLGKKLIDRAKELEMRFVLFQVKQKGLMKKAKQLGFIVADQGVSLMMREI